MLTDFSAYSVVLGGRRVMLAVGRQSITTRETYSYLLNPSPQIALPLWYNSSHQ
jgi:hypothetical protein